MGTEIALDGVEVEREIALDGVEMEGEIILDGVKIDVKWGSCCVLTICRTRR